MPPRNKDFLDKRDISWNNSSHQTSIILKVSLRYKRTFYTRTFRRKNVYILYSKFVV